jgi:hypothetical protein
MHVYKRHLPYGKDQPRISYEPIPAVMFASWRVDVEQTASGTGRVFDAAEVIAAGKRHSSHSACNACRTKKVGSAFGSSAILELRLMEPAVEVQR